MTVSRLALLTGLAAGFLLSACQPAPPDESAPSDAPAQPPETGEEAAPSALPGNDIWIAEISLDANDIPSLSAPRNLTDRAGYDNQPWLAGADLLFTRGDDATGETDIYAIGIETGALRQITDTPDASEYSPQIAPDGRLSYLYQPPGGYAGNAYLASLDNAQRERAHELAPVGYYLFSADMDHIAVFALGAEEGDPNTLQLIDRRAETESPVLISENPGRALARSPSNRVDAYVTLQAEGDLGYAIWELDFTSGELTGFLMLPEEAQDFGVTTSPIPDADLVPVDRFYAMDGDQLVYLDAMGRPGRAAAEWLPVEGGDLSAYGLTGVTRLALSADGSQIAIVAEDPSP